MPQIVPGLAITTTHQNQGAPAAPFYALPPPTFPSVTPFLGSGPVSAPNFIANLMPDLPEQKPPGAGLAIGTVKAFLKAEDIQLPSAVKTVGVAVNAALTGKKLAENIQDALDAGQSAEEAYLCQTAKTITEELSGKIFKGAVVGGIPAYLAAAVASPPLAATVPIVVTLIPPAYQGAQTAAKVVGKTTETICHQGFDLAKQLTQKGN